MRIIGGTHKRRIIRAPSRLPVRPTTDLAKEALFNVLNNHLDFEGLLVLDLFSGTGNISYEFASRGAGRVLSVDHFPACVVFTRKTAEQLGFTNVQAVRSDVFRFISHCKSRFDLVFADPPFDWPHTAALPERIFGSGLIGPGGWLVLEHGKEVSFDQHDFYTGQRKYGRVRFSFFIMPESPTA